MGMYDYIKCEYPLPGDVPEWALSGFQTKDLDCLLDEYVITEDGRLVNKTDSMPLNSFTGTINFYTSNVVASGPGIYTRDGEDAHFLEFNATFVSGHISSITNTENRRQRAAKYKRLAWPELTNKDRIAIEARESEQLVGRNLWLFWGGDITDGYEVKVVAQNNRSELIVNSDQGGFEKLHTSDRDRLLFDSYDDGKQYKADRKARWEAKRREYEEEISTPR